MPAWLTMTDFDPHPIPDLRGRRVAVGMSGGLDSTVVAALCHRAGAEVLGMTLHMFKEGSRCCSIEDVERARKVCDQLGVRHAVVNAVQEFEETIIQPFVKEYAAGRTPSPCILCNEFIKFGILHRRARQLGCSRVATGHYARLDDGGAGGTLRLLAPRDANKDQTYFLHRLSQDQLGRCLFPLEGWTKDEVAAYAEQNALPVRRGIKAESQDLCFVPDDGHAEFVETRRPELAGAGAITDEDGAELGVHRGIHRYTIGQRKGIGVAAPTRLYVKELDPDANRVVVAPRENLQSVHVRAEKVHWIAGAPPADSFEGTARIRYRSPASSCRVDVLDEETVDLTFDEPQFAVTPGQAAVVYRGPEVLGGGWISTRRRETA